MRAASLAEVSSEVAEIQSIYGRFDLDLQGRPTTWWESRNLARWRPPEMFEHAFFPGMYLHRVLVNQRLVGPLDKVYSEIMARWTSEARRAYGLHHFVKCYCFGDGETPNLFWYGAAWRLSDQVGGDGLADAVKIFTRHGFTHCWTQNKKRIRDFEFY